MICPHCERPLEHWAQLVDDMIACQCGWRGFKPEPERDIVALIPPVIARPPKEEDLGIEFVCKECGATGTLKRAPSAKWLGLCRRCSARRGGDKLRAKVSAIAKARWEPIEPLLIAMRKEERPWKAIAEHLRGMGVAMSISTLENHWHTMKKGGRR